MEKGTNIFLFSIDLEDVREGVRDGHKYQDRVEENTLRYLAWLEKYKASCTFFTVGKVAEKYPHLIRKIAGAGHELACHTWSHIPLDQQNPEEFRRDLDRNINALYKAGAGSVTGFRAPVFSLTSKTAWAHEVLASCGIRYSSSVLPAKNPLYGWEEFGAAPQKLKGGLIEIPISLTRFGPLSIPFAGGVYFRCLPFFFIRSTVMRFTRRGQAVLSYFHPYDLDAGQEQFMHAGINESRFYNYLMYYNRRNMISRLDRLMRLDLQIMRYDDYANTLK